MVELGNLATVVEYGSSAKTSSSGDIPVLRMGNLQRGSLDLSQLKYLPASHHEFPKLLLDDGDLLFNRTNSAELVGKSAVYHGVPSPCSFASYLIRVRLSQRVLPDFVALYINSPAGRAWVASVVSQQVGQANVNGSKLRALRIPVPTKDVQARILERVSLQISLADAAETSVSSTRQRAEQFLQVILRQAFQGRLVDPAD
jgi:type I restriction enzyme S subunit